MKKHKHTYKKKTIEKSSHRQKKPPISKMKRKRRRIININGTKKKKNFFDFFEFELTQDPMKKTNLLKMQINVSLIIFC